MTDTKMLNELLQLLSKRKPGTSWKIYCVYADGAGDPLYEISLYYQGSAGRVRRKLVFNLNTGELIPNGCHVTHPAEATHIEDALLDLINEASITV